MTPATPRDAATVLLLRDDPLRVLMIRRPAKGTFAGALVFPGGVVEPEDHDERWNKLARGGTHDRAATIAGVRETFEEVGMLLGAALPEHRSGSFIDVAERAGGIELGGLALLARWVTPSVSPRRWDTRFLIAAAPDGQEPRPDGVEALTAHWVQPAELLASADSGDKLLPFPTRAHLHWLAQHGGVGEIVAHARSVTAQVLHPAVEFRDGTRWTTLPAGTPYGLTEAESVAPVGG